MNPDFNKVARNYDFLSRLVFGNTLVKAQISLLHAIPPKSKILIVGGGTGWILEEIAKIHPAGLRIIYIEVSSEMIRLSQKRQIQQNEVSFIHQPIENYTSDTLFDVVITPFFFDLFTEKKVNILFMHLDSLLKKNGLWLYTDFIPAKYQTYLWQKILLRMMYFFFQITSNVRTATLVDMDSYFQKRYTNISAQWFYHRFIRSNSYQKR